MFWTVPSLRRCALMFAFFLMESACSARDAHVHFIDDRHASRVSIELKNSCLFAFLWFREILVLAYCLSVGEVSYKRALKIMFSRHMKLKFSRASSFWKAREFVV